MTEELSYDGCARVCRTKGHTMVWGECEHATPPPCRHPGERLAWIELKNVVECAACGRTVGLLDLLDGARVTVSAGCLCADEGESGHTPACFKPIGWSLDPEQIRSLIEVLPPYVITNTLLGVFVHGAKSKENPRE